MKMLSVLAAAAFAALTGSALAAGDAANGEKVFNKCKACHAVGEGAANKVGPELNGVVGRKAASVAGYTYSPALKAAGEGGLAWTEADLSQWIANPKTKVPGNKMSFVGLNKEDEVADVLAYLGQFGADGKKK